MGYIVSAPLYRFQPSEHFLREKSIQHALFSRLQGRTLLPPYIKISGNRYDVIDGHNRLIVTHLFGDSEVKVYVPADEQDFFPEGSSNGWSVESIQEANKSLSRAFKTLPDKVIRIQGVYHIFSIEDLLDDYANGGVSPWMSEDLEFLQSLQTTLKHFNLN